MKSNLDDLFKSDVNQETGGIWMTLKPGVGFRVKRMGGANRKAVQKALAKHYKPMAKLLDAGSLPEETEREIQVKVLVEGCITDWKGIEIDGVVPPYSTEKCIEFLMGLPDLADTLTQYASDQTNYKSDDIEQLGNS